ncbi:MAG: hypothetical protein RL392_831 [Pseudomonadota bacterium]|jgi:hypothetical protein
MRDYMLTKTAFKPGIAANFQQSAVTKAPSRTPQ